MTRSTLPRSNNSKLKNAIYTGLAALFWLALWQFASVVIDQHLVLVSPIRASIALARLLKTQAFYMRVFFSFSRILLGFLLALLTGTALSLASYRYAVVARLMSPVMAAIRATPVASFVILLLIFVGSSNLSIYTAFLMVVPVLYENVLAGLHNADVKLLEMARVFRFSTGRRLRSILIPSAFPFLLSACASGLGICWKAGIAAEVIGQSSNSIGDALYRAKLFFATDDLFAWTLAIIILSLLFEKGILSVIRRIRDHMEGGGIG